MGGHPSSLSAAPTMKKKTRASPDDTYSDGVTPTAREAAAAALIRSKRPADHLLLVPKNQAPEGL